MESSGSSQYRRGLATVAPFCKGHLSPTWIGSNFRAEPHCCSLLREGTPLDKMYPRLLVANRAPEDAPWTDLFSGAVDGPRQDPLMCWGSMWSRGLLCAYRDQHPTLAEHSTPLEDPQLANLPPILSSRGKAMGTVGGGQGLNLSSAPPLSSSETLATFQTLRGPSVSSSVKTQMLTPS